MILFWFWKGLIVKMKNRFVLFTILTACLFLLSSICFAIMKIGGNLIRIDMTVSTGGAIYSFNSIFGLIGLILYNILKINYDKMFNKIYKSYAKKSQRFLMWLAYIWISIMFWIFVFFKSNIGGGLTNLYQFKIKNLQGIYAIDILFVLPLWNIIYNIFRSVKIKIRKSKK